MDVEAEARNLTFDRDLQREVVALVVLAMRVEREACADVAKLILKRARVGQLANDVEQAIRSRSS